MDLDAYLERIAWRGARSATPEVLAGIVAHHVRAVPFENFDVLLGRGVSIDLPAVEAKLVRARRGGYCFEHATLMAAALRELGFEVRTHSARVVMKSPRELAPRTHMLLTVGDVVLDPGFGGQAPGVPVPLDGAPAGEHRFVRDGDAHALEMRDGEGWARLWVTTLEHDQAIDFQMANHYTATYPTSPFVTNLLAQSRRGGVRVGIANRAVTLTEGGQTRRLELADRAALRELVAAHFGFDLPELLALRVPSVPEWS